MRHDGSIAHMVRRNGSNPFDQPLWRDVLRDLMGHVPAATAAIGLGLAGYGESRTVTAQQQEAVRHAVGCRIELMNDVAMACAGAFAGQPGVLLLSGTGSMAWATDGAGRQCRVGGWGSLFGDEGSAFWIGRAALAVMTELLDGRRTADAGFLASCADAMGLPRQPEACGAALLEWYGTLDHERSAVAALARSVSDLAERGCPTAARLMTEAAGHLIAHIEAARRKFPDVALPWSYAGGTLRSSFLRGAIAARCGAPAPPRLPPIGGGVLTAARLAGWAPDANWINQLARTLDAAGLGS
ncbi:N-acetylglucosamine kinase [Nguyenibacter vanlangensis]|uniref:N-acetylglucosamine kinase n=1 Tax=Nguyenibacter vanlangensis TaxID=1216886 RepID=A0A7Y7M726_9PROT|nr:BadF/BadG/BcrA/BcrD ATPase family protein [Nguyenibacter vanlangensis]NVN11559.1 N-acetylglucosamine kinase [Nguyenibacter vanlangensis]